MDMYKKGIPAEKLYYELYNVQTQEEDSSIMVKQASTKGINWFQDIRFGMFIYWGLYSLPGRGEWAMHFDRFAIPEYEQLAERFNPVRFNADEWVNLAAMAGQKYIVITSRHHDGFSMYDTALSDYKVTNTPFQRDPLAELAEACERNGEVKLGFYVSLLDWHHPAYRFREESGLIWDDYLAFLHGQVRELCQNYGEIACFWFDGDWPRRKVSEDDAYFQPGGSFEYEKLYNMIHGLQPDAVVVNNRHDKPLPGEDVQGFEQDLPGVNSAGFNTTEKYNMPLEVCMTINDNWGYFTGDENHKSPLNLIHNLARSASADSNYLLNVGPTVDGVISKAQSQRLLEIGHWLQSNGEAIYGTRAGVIAPTVESVSTSKDTTHFVHVLEYLSDCISLKGVPESVESARLLRDSTPVKMTGKEDTISLTIPPEMRDPYNTVVILE
jgi:alpha-L-fucosidase